MSHPPDFWLPGDRPLRADIDPGRLSALLYRLSRSDWAAQELDQAAALCDRHGEGIEALRWAQMAQRARRSAL